MKYVNTLNSKVWGEKNMDKLWTHKIYFVICYFITCSVNPKGVLLPVVSIHKVYIFTCSVNPQGESTRCILLPEVCIHKVYYVTCSVNPHGVKLPVM